MAHARTICHTSTSTTDNNKKIAFGKGASEDHYAILHSSMVRLSLSMMYSNAGSLMLSTPGVLNNYTMVTTFMEPELGLGRLRLRNQPVECGQEHGADTPLSVSVV